MVLEEINLLLILLQGHVARAPTKGRHMGLPLPADSWVCPYHKSLFTAISDGECRIIMLLLKTIEFKNWRFQLFIYSYSITKEN
jgi:hypothetical protein